MMIQKNMGSPKGTPQPPAAPEPEYLTIRDVARFTWRNGWLILACTALGIGLAALYATSTTEEFTARATILIDRDQTQIASVTGTTITLTNAPVDDDVQVILSDDVLRPVASRLDLTSDPEFDPSPSVTSRLKRFVLGRAPSGERTEEQDMNVTLSNLRDRLTVRRVGQSNVLVLSTRSSDPQKAAQITNAVSDSFIEQEIEAKSAAARRGSAWLGNRLEEVRGLANSAAMELAQFKSENELVDFGDGRFLDEQQLVQLNEQFMAARASVRGIDARLKTLEAALSGGLEPENLPEDPSNPLALALRQQVVAQQATLRDLANRFGEDAINTLSAQRELEALTTELRSEIERSVEMLRSDYRSALLTEATLADEMQGLIRDQSGKSTTRVEFQQLESQSRAFRAMYESLLQQYMRSVQLESFPVTDARVVSRASVPLSKSHPRTSLILLAGATLGVLFGFAIGLLRTLFKGSIDSAEQVARVTSVPCVGAIPPRKRRNMLNSRPIGLFDEPNADYAKALRECWAALQHICRAGASVERHKTVVIGITGFESAGSRHGVGLDLGQVLAYRGLRVLYVGTEVVETDVPLSYGHQHEGTEGTGFHGASTHVGDGELVVIVPETEGNRRARLSPLDASVGLENVLDGITGTYDAVVLDLPPIRETPELFELQRQMDCLVLQTEYRQTPMDDLLDVVAATRPGAPQVSAYLIAQGGWRPRLENLGGRLRPASDAKPEELRAVAEAG